MTDARTIQIYETQAEEFARRFAREPYPLLLTFMKRLPSGGRVLDFGCGPGMDAGIMAESGFVVDGIDATQAMVDLANARPGVTARLGSFDDLDAVALYDGIWASYSLLHAPRTDMPRHLSAIARALKPGGLLGLTVKEGTGEARDTLGRKYTYFAEDELRGLLADAGLTVTDMARGESRGLDGTLAPWISLTSHA